MSIAKGLSSILTRLTLFLYTDRVERITKRTGIHPGLVDLYWSVLSRIHGDTVTLQAGELEARFIVTTASEHYRFQNLIGEDRVIEDVLNELRTDDVFYDIGANVGMYTCFVGQQLPPAQVVAFEPHPTNVRRLEQNLELNELDAVIVDDALSDEAGEAELAIDTRDEAGAGRHALAVESEENTIAVDLVTGDSLVADGNVPAPTVLKIDVEGAELDVLRGLRNSLAEHCRLCYVEVHPDRIENYGGTAERLETFLSEIGFVTETIYEREDDEYFLKARKE